MTKVITAVNCKTFNEFETIINYLLPKYRKCFKQPLTEHWDRHKDEIPNICVDNQGGYGNKKHYKNKGIRIISFDKWQNDYM